MTRPTANPTALIRVHLALIDQAISDCDLQFDEASEDRNDFVLGMLDYLMRRRSHSYSTDAQQRGFEYMRDWLA